VSTFVSVGNAKQPFVRLLQAVQATRQALPGPVFVQHGHTPWQPTEGIEAQAFIGMEEFAQRVQDSQVVVLHAGAGSVIHAVRAGKVPIVAPRRQDLGEHLDNHQLEFARELAAAGKVILFNDKSGFGLAIRQAQALQLQQKAAPQPPLVGLVAERLRQYPAR
jgi:UDP-N-acetylglucosamine transferase subunit ALG13